MVDMVERATHTDASFWVVVREFAVEMSIGVALGLLGALALLPLFRGASASERGLYPVLARVLAGALYAATSLAHGSGLPRRLHRGLVLRGCPPVSAFVNTCTHPARRGTCSTAGSGGRARFTSPR